MYEELEKTRNALIEYIEATYHITDRELLRRRRTLLEANGVISQLPFIESTAKYMEGREYSDLNVPQCVRELLTELASVKPEPVLFNPPYSHQAEAIEAVVGQGHKNLIVTTGTGSGKTETFLLPILGRLAREAATSPDAFGERAVRALLLYPMNALVNDQLSRLRLLFGANATAGWFTSKAGRPAKFGRYTSRTPFPGIVPSADDTKKLTDRFRGLRFYYDLEQQAALGDDAVRATIRQLKQRGKWPCKIDPTGAENGFSTWFGRGKWHEADGTLRRTVERFLDPELLTRFEIQQAPPDLLVTNYSMLEYMMLRPIERSIFDLSRAYYDRHPDETFLLVLDEAHLYRGAQGTEVAMLIRRLRSRLGLTPDRLQVICTSASFENAERAGEFAAGLSGTSKNSFVPLAGEKIFSSPSGAGDGDVAAILSGIDLAVLRGNDQPMRLRAIEDLALLASSPLACFPYEISIPEQETTKASDKVEIGGLNERFEAVSENLSIGVGGDARTANKYLCVTSLSSTLRVEAQRSDQAGGISLSTAGKIEIPRDSDVLSRILYELISDLPVLGRLLNLTSGAREPSDTVTHDGAGPAREVSELATLLFPKVIQKDAMAATDVLIELASMARKTKFATPLFAARVHRFYRGLPGIWACSDKFCSKLPEDQRGKAPVGTMYVQPVRTCECGSRVFELYTCRTCGSAYFYAWTLEPEKPKYLWHQDVGEVDETDDELHPVHLLLEDPQPYFDPNDRDAQTFDERYLDPVTGRVSDTPTANTRAVWLPPLSLEEKQGQFKKCPRCQTAGRNDRSEIQDLKTKGDEPFQQLIASQLLEQPPRPDISTPLKGRKVLIFSDGRQPASRLAGKLGSNSLRDSIRPLLLDGYRFLRERWPEHRREVQSLKFAYVALHCGAARNGVVINPQLKSNEQMFFGHAGKIETLVELGADWNSFSESSDSIVSETPHSILLSFYQVLFNKQTGIHSLALGMLVPRLTNVQVRTFNALPAPAVSPDIDEDRRRHQLLELWLRLMAEHQAIHIPGTPPGWIDSTDGARLNLQSGKFTNTIGPLVTNAFFRVQFASSGGVPGPWLKFLSSTLGYGQNAGRFLLDGKFVALAPPEEADWQRCTRCSWVQPRSELAPDKCFGCGGSQTVRALDVENDSAFRKRKTFYRRLTERLTAPDRGTWAPHPFVAKEHTAAIGSVDSQKSFSLAEWYEMRFQDLDIAGPVDEPGGCVDVLSCTTTMEVGIDIGSLTAVSMRNVPPNRANYQQRAGRAGRRGSSLSTVITYADQGSHDQKFFSEPAAMISGPVTDPILNLDNPDIVMRHGFAFVLSLFQQEMISDDSRQNANIFSSLGMVDDFKKGKANEFSYRGLENWIQKNKERLSDLLSDLLPLEYVDQGHDPNVLPGLLLQKLVDIGAGPDENNSSAEFESNLPDQPDSFNSVWETFGTVDVDDEINQETADNANVESPETPRDVSKLLDLLFDKAVLPSYAFPTDVVSMTVFDRTSTPYRTVVKYAPQQGLSQALSSYAPGREIYIDGLRHLSFAIWSPFSTDRFEAWRDRKLYFECSCCGYVEVRSQSEGFFEGEARDCPACKETKGLGPAQWWMTPPGFAHPFDLDEGLVDDPPEATRPTKAKLSAKFQQSSEADENFGTDACGFVKWARKEDLYITNAGSHDPQNLGFRYCTLCGRIEPNGWIADSSQLSGNNHPKPFPEHRGRNGGPVCNGTVRTTTLGTKFRSDVVLFRFRLGNGICMQPGSALARIGLGTLANAMSATVVRTLEIERGNVGGEYRPALTSGGETGSEVDVYLYDTTAGGAGFVQTATKNAQGFLVETLKLLETCDCTHSCYKCLHTYDNRYFHADLDRKLAASILRHVLGLEENPHLDAGTETRLLKTLERDLNDAGEEAILQDGYVELRSQSNKRIALGHSLAPNKPGTVRAAEAIAGERTYTILPHLLVERALPVAVLRARGLADTQLAVEVSDSLPVVVSGGTPLFTLSALANGWKTAEPDLHLNIGAPENKAVFILKLDAPLLERTPLKLPAGRNGVERVIGRIVEGSLLVMEKIASLPPIKKMDGQIAVVQCGDDVFRATGLQISVGYIQLRGEDRIKIGYSSSRKKCQPEMLKINGVHVLGILRGVYRDGRVIPFKKADNEG